MKQNKKVCRLVKLKNKIIQKIKKAVKWFPICIENKCVLLSLLFTVHITHTSVLIQKKIDCTFFLKLSQDNALSKSPFWPPFPFQCDICIHCFYVCRISFQLGFWFWVYQMELYLSGRQQKGPILMKPLSETVDAGCFWTWDYFCFIPKKTPVNKKKTTLLLM